MDSKRTTTRVSAVSMGVNLLLTAFKLLAGIIAGSAAMIADAVHSASDILGSAVVIVGAVVSGRDSDEGHPYGHEKLECIASIILGCILVTVGAGIGYSALKTVITGFDSIETPGLLALIAAVCSIVIKEAMYHFTMHFAKRINSISLKAEAWHHRSDAMSSIGSFAGILGARLGAPVLDPIAGIIICLFIFKAAFDIFRESVDRLVDKACDDETVSQMKRALIEVEGVEAVDDIKTRLFGSRVFVDIEIQVDGELPLRQAHDIAECAHDAIESAFPEVKHCTVHVNPHTFS